MQRPTRDLPEWYGVFDSRDVDVELRLTATNLDGSDVGEFETAVTSVMENAANILANAIQGR